ncbi:MAG TPA: HAD family phosphatase [Candidatus Acidoferrales bacterium]|nr:HAD family phosphatase [Candidatus Acidoferrales bacterium]
MTKVTAVFTDMGGVVLSNGWDRAARRDAASKFHLDWEEFEDRHELMLNAFETGQTTMDEYLTRTVFYRERLFSREEFLAFMYAQSRPMPESLDVMRRLAAAGRYLLAAINNESRELNEYRIKEFHLREYFEAFLSSCYLGVRKPDEAIYRLALSITQRLPEECVFIDDRGLNLECAKELGMHTIQFQNAWQLQQDLQQIGVEPAKA